MQSPNSLFLYPNGKGLDEPIKKSLTADAALVVVRNFLLPHEVKDVLEFFGDGTFVFNYFTDVSNEELVDFVPRIGELQAAMKSFGTSDESSALDRVICAGVRSGKCEAHYDPASVLLASTIHLQDLHKEGFTKSTATMYARRDGLGFVGDDFEGTLVNDPGAVSYVMSPGDLLIIGAGVSHEVTVTDITALDDERQSLVNGYGLGAGLAYDRLALVHTLTRFASA